ncbi:MAG TPA: CheR family methyltransferase [Prolixibacteraceae bacterium]|nr:CheR family methyltransferase [Prolixibacteraceae bacterium]HPS12192.1 CheR family methyltransferase [Prolixibacteraceae bacterium]
MNYNEAANLYSQQLTEDEFKRIQKFMLESLGIKLSPIKIVMVNSRLIKRLKKTGINNFKDYLDYAMSPEGKKSGEFECMIDELTTHKTEFFRESEHFDLLKGRILPEYKIDSRNPFKIWSAGCSTGEEAYSMAIVLSEFKLINPTFDFTIFATDISNSSVMKAFRAIYNREAVKNMEPNLVKKYFLASKDTTDNKVRVVKNLREKVHFSILNLVDDYFFQDNSLDVVFCRNTLIYFDDVSKRNVVHKLIEKVKPGGYLFVGLSETISQYSKAISQVSPSAYVKIN